MRRRNYGTFAWISEIPASLSSWCSKQVRHDDLQPRRGLLMPGFKGFRDLGRGIWDWGQGVAVFSSRCCKAPEPEAFFA